MPSASQPLDEQLEVLVDALNDGDYETAAPLVQALSRINTGADVGHDVASRWEARAHATRAGAPLPDPLTTEGAGADYQGLFGVLLRHSHDGIVLNTRASTWILEVSDSFCELTGYERAELVGRTSVELGLVTKGPVRDAAVAAAARGDEGLYDTVLTRKDGSQRLVRVLPPDSRRRPGALDRARRHQSAPPRTTTAGADRHSRTRS